MYQFINLRRISLITSSILIVACSTQEKEPIFNGEYKLSSPLPNEYVSHLVAPEHKLLRQAKARAKNSLAQRQRHSLYNQSNSREKYQALEESALHLVKKTPVSTFSIDVDTGSYSNVRRMLNDGYLPPKNAVRVEEFINYFDFDYQTPKTADIPFSVSTEIAPTPWNENTHLLQIGLQGYQQKKTERPAANLVFLVDVSGSMGVPNKLPLVKASIKLLTQSLSQHDRISIVTYSGYAQTLLSPTSGDKKETILNSFRNLEARGSTNGGEAIFQAYRLAKESFITGGINRVIIATDGDFNVGLSDFDDLKALIEEKRKTGISLSTLGFGEGNYNDHLMEQLADAGNGNYSYIDSAQEAKRVLVDKLSSTINTIAKDVKIQIEFNPKHVAEYRLIGYENRQLKREDFNNDKVDAGEIGEGHNVTAFYEITLTTSKHRQIDDTRYSVINDTAKESQSSDFSSELAFIKLRYKEPNGDISKLMKSAILKDSINSSFIDTSNRFKFATSVTAFAQMLRGSRYMDNFSYDQVQQLAESSKSNDTLGYKSELVRLVALAKALQ